MLDRAIFSNCLRLGRHELSEVPGAPTNPSRNRFYALLDLVDSNQNDEVDWPELEALLGKSDPKP
ncbi:MAG: hypothetical protein P8N31_08795 [Planctomycetota bacterium]|nr:hypothetical protein [Planctomycetota bacterium]MDG2143638.1 hypothetical protein [Planctomycetota bacterium]